MPDVIVIAGPNGAGKSTFLPVAADIGEPHALIRPAAIPESNRVDPDKIIRASGKRAVRQRVSQLEGERAHFSVETTLAGRTRVEHIRKWKKRRYRVFLVFVTLDTNELSFVRVVQRALLGGHYVPMADIQKRFVVAHNHFFECLPFTDFWVLADNSDRRPGLVAWGWGVHNDLRMPPQTYVANGSVYEHVKSIVSLASFDSSVKRPDGIPAERDDFTFKILKRLKERVADEIQKRPKGNYVAISRGQGVEFVLPGE